MANPGVGRTPACAPSADREVRHISGEGAMKFSWRLMLVAAVCGASAGAVATPQAGLQLRQAPAATQAKAASRTDARLTRPGAVNQHVQPASARDKFAEEPARAGDD